MWSNSKEEQLKKLLELYVMSSIKRHLVIDPKSLLHSFFHFANCITLHKGKHKVLIWYVMLEGFLGHNKLVLN